MKENKTSPISRQTLLQLICVFLILPINISAQNTSKHQQKFWHNTERSLRYLPKGDDFVIENGNQLFNRALYGGNTAFRVEAGDLPEFAFYMPGMGGNFKLGIISTNQSKWLINSNKIISRYRAGSMLYEISDSLLKRGTLLLTVLAMSDTEGMILKLEAKNLIDSVQLVWAYGGATGKKFSRDGDLNVDPESSFYLTPENCSTNTFEITGQSFKLLYGSKKILSEDERYFSDKVVKSSKTKEKEPIPNLICGIIPEVSKIKIADASKLSSPLLLIASGKSATPVIAGNFVIQNNKSYYFIIQNPESKALPNYSEVSSVFENAEKARLTLANRIKIETPDPFINTLGPIIGIAGDAIYEYPTYLHGAIGWRMRLNGWRGPYTGDALGWHDRAKTHLSAYSKSQIITPESGPVVPDTMNNLAREEEKIGNAMFTSGYICRAPNGKFSAHHYDMNLVYIDAFFRHILWTGDLDFARQIWPVLQRHLAWEKRNFDGDNDYLYDAYCCIWASDALQYNGGAVTHSSAYNYYANKMAAKIAHIIGENAEPFEKEAQNIRNAINNRLWIPSKGWYAEYQDGLGYKQIHPSAALWTVYHTLDSEVPDIFQAYQVTRYVDTEIPHIPVRATNLKDDNYYTLSTSNWMPYEWSINNVVPAEVFHTSLAYWQAGRADEAFKIWKSNILDAMYMGSSPGNFLQISVYDANRGEVYRDFADCVGMASRSLVEGLFGIHPNALDGMLTIRPGFPAEWSNASLQTPDISFSFKRDNNKSIYTIVPTLPKRLSLCLNVAVQKDIIKTIIVNGKKTSWKNVTDAMGYPQIQIMADPAAKYEIVLEQTGKTTAIPENAPIVTSNADFTASFGKAKVMEVKDPQKSISYLKIKGNKITAKVVGEIGHRTIFAKLFQGELCWWAPVNFEITEPLSIIAPLDPDSSGITFIVNNNTLSTIQSKMIINTWFNYSEQKQSFIPGTNNVTITADKLKPGSNLVRIKWNNGQMYEKCVKNWNLKASKNTIFEKVDLSDVFNEKLNNIFNNAYLSPRWKFPTLALPKQGYGSWSSPKVKPEINDSMFRVIAGPSNEIVIPQGIPFATPSNPVENNIVFTSLWDNYPKEISIPLRGKASHAYLLMTGTSYHMQSQLVNAEILIQYTDGTNSKLELRNPDTWWPIERDFYSDGFAFKLSEPCPVRIHLKTGLMTNSIKGYKYAKFSGISSNYISGGAATVYDLPLDFSKQLKNLTLKTLSYELIVGLMAITLERK